MDSLKEFSKVKLSNVNILDKMNVSGKILFVYEDHNENFALSLRNLKKINKIPVKGINPYDVIKHDFLVIDKVALDKLEQRLVG